MDSAADPAADAVAAAAAAAAADPKHPTSSRQKPGSQASRLPPKAKASAGSEPAKAAGPRAAPWRLGGAAAPGEEDLALKLAAARGWSLVEHDASTGQSMWRWNCGAGHQWACALHAAERDGCKVCKAEEKARRRSTLEMARKFAADKGGLCLSEGWRGSGFPLSWRCAEGHEWDARWDNVKAGHWCRKCHQRRRFVENQERLRAVAEARGGMVLSAFWPSGDERSHLRCALGHEWWTSPKTVVAGKAWCPVCAGKPAKGPAEPRPEKGPKKFRDPLGHSTKRLGIEDLRSAAAEFGGTLLSERYSGVNSKYRWRCARGHEWEAQGFVVRGGHWCRRCAYEDQKSSDAEELRNAAAERGGACLSEEFASLVESVGWRCARGHEWSASWASVRGGSWCPKCAKDWAKDAPGLLPKCARRGDVQLVRALLRAGADPDEEDSAGRTALQHLAEGGHGGEDAKALRRLLAKGADPWRRGADGLAAWDWALLEENAQALRAIREVCGERPKPGQSGSGPAKKGRGRDEPAAPRRPRKLSLLFFQNYALSKGGSCLSEAFVHSKSKMRFRCRSGHEWEALPSNMASHESWCPVCSGNERHGLERFQKIAAERGGACLSEAYEGAAKKLRFRCAQGHEWEARPSCVNQGRWCHRCGGTARLDLEEMKRIAEARGGACLSESYKNARSKLRFRCAEGHEWESSAVGVKYQETWCPACARPERELAAARERRYVYLSMAAAFFGGVCLSAEGSGPSRKARLRCSEGHEWEIEGLDERMKALGRWCPACAEAHPEKPVPKLPSFFKVRKPAVAAKKAEAPAPDSFAEGRWLPAPPFPGVRSFRAPTNFEPDPDGPFDD